MKFCHFKLLLPQGQQPLIKVRLDKKGLLILLFGYRIFFSDPVISHLKLGCHYIFCSRFIQRNAQSSISTSLDSGSSEAPAFSFGASFSVFSISVPAVSSTESPSEE
ncbi:unnamed protein product, partial [Vitis vinifera]